MTIGRLRKLLEQSHKVIFSHGEAGFFVIGLITPNFHPKVPVIDRKQNKIYRRKLSKATTHDSVP
jgi:hypothetical protein